MLKLVFIFLIFITNSKSSDWYYSEQIVFGHIYKFECINDNYCYIVFRDGLEIKVYISINQGMSWNLKSNYNNLDSDPLLLRIWDTDMPDSNHIYYSYNDDFGYIKRSKNGGKSFKNIFIEANSNLRDIQMIDSLRGIIHKHQVLYYTEDGFDTFEKITYQSEFAIKPIEFINDSVIELFAISKGMFRFNLKSKNLEKTSDFNFDSTKQYNNQFVSFDKMSNGIIYKCGQRLTGITDTAYDIIFKSSDYGKTWFKQLDTLVDPKQGLQDIAFYDDINGIAVAQGGQILVTNDGGVNWRYEERPQELIDERPAVMHVLWAGKSPIIATLQGHIYLYQGDFFKFEEEPDLFKLSGRVMTEDSVGVPNVPIVMSIYIPVKTTLDTIYTDNNGYYESPKLLETKILLELPKSNYQRRYIPDYSNIELISDSTFNIIMEKPENYYSVSGQVFDKDIPIPGFFIEINSLFGDTTIQANKNGEYFIEKVPEGNVVITHPYNLDNFIIESNISPINYSFDLNSDTSNYNFSLNNRKNFKIYYVTGKVTLNGLGVSNVKIIEPGYSFEFYTNDEGIYITPLYSLSPGYKPSISIDSIQNGIKYNITPVNYKIDFYDYMDDVYNIDFELSPITSVDTKDYLPIIYPNPANETVSISGIDFGKVEIFNSLGQLLIQSEIQGTSNINTSTIHPGIYLLKIEHGNELTFEKLIINK